METLMQQQRTFMDTVRDTIQEEEGKEWTVIILQNPEIHALLDWFNGKGEFIQGLCKALIEKMMKEAEGRGDHNNSSRHDFVVTTMINSLTELKHWAKLQESVKGAVRVAHKVGE